MCVISFRNYFAVLIILCRKCFALLFVCCTKIFVKFIFVAFNDYDNILTMKISRFTVVLVSKGTGNESNILLSFSWPDSNCAKKILVITIILHTATVQSCALRFCRAFFEWPRLPWAPFYWSTGFFSKQCTGNIIRYCRHRLKVRVCMNSGWDDTTSLS